MVVEETTEQKKPLTTDDTSAGARREIQRQRFFLFWQARMTTWLRIK